MKIMLLAAGRGERMRPLTDNLPKPLLPVGDSTLIEMQLGKLKQAGFSKFVINLNYLGHMIEAHLGNGERYGVEIVYSHENEALETGGGVKRALPLLGDAPFGIVNADVYTEYDFARLHDPLPAEVLANFIMVDNPPHHPEGDFGIEAGGAIVTRAPCFTYSGVSVMRPAFVADEPLERFMLRKKMLEAIPDGSIMGTLYQGYWCDVGTPERYQQLLDYLGTSPA